MQMIKILALLLLMPAVFAANDGKVGTQSTAEISISLAILPSIQIETVSDVRLNIVDRSIDTTFSEPFCVRGDDATKYSIIAYGSSSSEGFTLLNNEGEQLSYLVSFRGNTAAQVFDSLAPSTASPVYNTAASELSCVNGSEFKITFRSEDLQLSLIHI